MSHAHRALVPLAAAALLCAQGCRGRADAPQAAALTTPTPSPSPTPTPSPSPSPYPARERGDDAFEPFINLSGGRRFESRAVGQKPLRKDLDFGASYPVLSGDDGPAAREFNRHARALVLEDVTPYLNERPRPGSDREPGVELEHHVTHKVVYASDEVVSVLFYFSGYASPAAHGYHYPVTFNFDLKAGREIELARVFKPGSGYLKRIAELCDADLRRQFGKSYPGGQVTSLEGGLKPKAKNFSSWVVTRAGLVFIFEEYQVMSYADGEPKVLIPFDAVREMFDPRGALARLAAHE